MKKTKWVSDKTCPKTVESLRNEKLFQKATKAQYKQLEAMQKKHKKERETMQKNQCTAIEKLAAKKTDHHKDTDMIAMVKDQVASLQTIYFPMDFFIDNNINNIVID